MLVDLTSEEIKIIKIVIEVAQFESQLPESEKDEGYETVKNLLRKINFTRPKNLDKKGEWLLVDGENFMSIIPMFSCSLCKNTVSTYTPPMYCPSCGSSNIYKLNRITSRTE